jgi:hypothetical protein
MAQRAARSVSCVMLTHARFVFNRVQISSKGRRSKLADSLSDRPVRTTSCAKIYRAWRDHAVALLTSDTEAKRFAIQFAADNKVTKMSAERAEESMVSQLR